LLSVGLEFARVNNHMPSILLDAAPACSRRLCVPHQLPS
jgi:hypothetical protein